MGVSLASSDFADYTHELRRNGFLHVFLTLDTAFLSLITSGFLACGGALQFAWHRSRLLLGEAPSQHFQVPPARKSIDENAKTLEPFTVADGHCTWSGDGSGRLRRQKRTSVCCGNQCRSAG
jgi:hypothetical protein